MPIPTQKLRIEQNIAFQNTIGFITWFKTITLPDYVGGGKKTVVWCPKCGLYNTINHIELSTFTKNVLFLKCQYYPNSVDSYAFGTYAINQIIDSFVTEYFIEYGLIKSTPELVEMFNFIKALE